MVRLCSYCDQPGTMRCKKHRQYLCGNSRCIRLHRWDDKETCRMVAMNSTGDYFIYGWAIVLAAVIVAVIYLHFN